jgi:hypothetical protein
MQFTYSAPALRNQWHCNGMMLITGCATDGIVLLGGGPQLKHCPVSDLPTPHAPAAAPQVMCNGKERTQAQWQALMTQAGFTIKSITQSPDMAAIVAVPAS